VLVHYLRKQLHARLPQHHDVEKYEVDVFFCKDIGSLVSVGRHETLETLLAQAGSEEFSDIEFIVNDQDALCTGTHGLV